MLQTGNFVRLFRPLKTKICQRINGIARIMTYHLNILYDIILLTVDCLLLSFSYYVAFSDMIYIIFYDICANQRI